MTATEALQNAAAAQDLRVTGTCPTQPADGLGTGTIALLGPDEPAFWARFTASPEYSDGQPHPMDRWSRRIIAGIARDTGGQTVFPFGQPARPFLTWALRSGAYWASPVGLLVHQTSGLLASFRGAVVLETPYIAAPAQSSPCVTCVEQPCQTACPVGALTQNGYDLPGCHDYLDTKQGNACLTQGCAVRMACPLSQSVQRAGDQSAFHMKSFHPGKT